MRLAVSQGRATSVRPPVADRTRRYLLIGFAEEVPICFHRLAYDPYKGFRSPRGCYREAALPLRLSYK